MIPGNFDLPSLVWSDTWLGVPSIVVIDSATNLPPADDLASVVMDLRPINKSTPRVTQTLSTANGEIIITSASGWQIEIPAQTLLVPRPDTVDDYRYSMQFTDVNGLVQTYLAGSFKVILEPTR